jgi:hypothetical protein
MAAVATARRDPMFMWGLIGTLVIHAGVFGAMWAQRHAHADDRPPVLGAFVEAQLVKFGKPRDLKFLPHKEGIIKNNEPPPDIKIAREMDAPVAKPDDKSPEKYDPLKKTHAEAFKHLQDDDRPEAVTEEGGSLKGSRAGTAETAVGDPYILALIDRVGSAWQIPTTIKDAELANLTADVCLSIAGNGALERYKIVRSSGNSQFDSSLDATLSTIHELPPPPEKWRRQAANGVNGSFCATFVKQ